MDSVFIDVLTSTAVGAATVLLVIFFAGIGIPRRSPATIRRIVR